jgi:hypothetical protein
MNSNLSITVLDDLNRDEQYEGKQCDFSICLKYDEIVFLIILL